VKLHFWQFYTFFQFKNRLLAIFEIAKKWRNLVKIKFRETDLFGFTSFLVLDFFFNFLAHHRVMIHVNYCQSDLLKLLSFFENEKHSPELFLVTCPSGVTLCNFARAITASSKVDIWTRAILPSFPHSSI